ncbi:MAG TPA: PH domain-containing protein [Verrucomicrobiae bacterium]|nr:PH domain-containing protein [Verrucomicrobiae bacterium]
MNSQTYPAPWGKTLCWVSLLASALLLGVVLTLTGRPGPELVRWLAVLPALILPGTALFIIRSYAIEPNALAIRRLLWTTRLPLSGLQSATAEPDAMRRSIRLCGNGGLFSITGWYRNRALGNYRAFVTDLTQTVVLRFPKKTIVVSPENPERFVSDISQFAFRTT